MRTRRWAMLPALAVTLLLAACTGGGGDAGAQRVADWIGEQDGVLTAEGLATADYDTVLSLDVALDPQLSDDDLVDLSHRIDDRAERSGFSQYQIGYTVGQDRAFASLGGEPTLQVFLGIRHDPASTEAYARGGGQGVRGFFFVSGPPAADLLTHFDHLVQLARDAGGVQSNLPFTAGTVDDSVTVSGTYEVSPAPSFALWQQLDGQFVLDKAYVHALETGAQLLSVWVIDAETQAAVEAAAAEQSEVEVDVYVTE